MTGEHPDSEAPHLARDGREHIVAVLEQDAERRVREHLLDGAVDLDRFFLRHRSTRVRGGGGGGNEKAGPAHRPSPALTYNAARRVAGGPGDVKQEVPGSSGRRARRS